MSNVFNIITDSLFSYPVGYDLFKFMKINKKLYGFVNIAKDDPICVENLWNASKEFQLQPKYRQIPKQSLSNPYYINLSHVFFNEINEPDVFYNNFELSHVSIWKNPIWLDYIDYILKLGGIYSHRWGDAPIHTIGLGLFLSRHHLHSFSDISYRHYPFVDQEPTGLAIPTYNPLKPSYMQHCKYYSEWKCFATNGYNITGNYTMSYNLTMKTEKIDLVSIFSDVNGNKNKGNAVTDSVMKNLINSDRVLYTFGHKGRENLLIATIESFYDNYLQYYPNKIIVFFNRQNPLNITMFKNGFILDIKKLVSFHGVVLENILPYDPVCTSINIEVRGAAYFLRFEVFRILELEYEYNWAFRFADDASIKNAITYDLFDNMLIQKKKYAYISAVRDHRKCVNPLWQKAMEFCRPSVMVSIPNNTESCGDLFKLWPENVVIFTNFEISHVSIWKSNMCTRVESEFSIQNKSSSIGKPFRYDAIGDAAIHTLCVLTSLQPTDIIRLEDVSYEAVMNGARHSDTDSINSDVKAVSSLNSLQLFTLRNKSETLTLDSQSLESVKLLNQKSYESINLINFDNKFKPQQFGWLGGDVAASIPLPRIHEQIGVDVDYYADRYIWLFGDTLVGSSSTERLVLSLELFQ